MDLLQKAMNVRKIYTRDKVGYKLEDKREFTLVRNILSKYGLPTDNFDKNLSELIINEKKRHRSTDSYPCMYNPRLNTIDMPHNKDEFIHGLYHMASNNLDNKEALEGCKIRSVRGVFGVGLNEGITDYLTKITVSSYKSQFPYESFFVSYITKIYGMDILKEHFNGDAISFYASFKQDEMFIRNFTSFLDNYYNATQEFYFKSEDGVIKREEADSVTDSFIDCVSEFVKLLQLKKIDETEFLTDLNDLMNSTDNEYANVIGLFFDFSTYRGKDNIFRTIKEEIGEEGFNL